MATKNEVMKEEAMKHDGMEEKSSATEEVAAPIAQDAAFLEFDDAFDWRDEAGTGENNGQETVFSNLGMMLQREIQPGNDGKSYQNFGISFSMIVNGKKVRQRAYFSPPAKNTSMYELLDAIYADQMSMPVDIVKNVSVRMNGNKQIQNVTYFLRISAASDFGGKISCDMSPSKRADTVAFLNLIEQMKFKGMIK